MGFRNQMTLKSPKRKEKVRWRLTEFADVEASSAEIHRHPHRLRNSPSVEKRTKKTHSKHSKPSLSLSLSRLLSLSLSLALKRRELASSEVHPNPTLLFSVNINFYISFLAKHIKVKGRRLFQFPLILRVEDNLIFRLFVTFFIFSFLNFSWKMRSWILVVFSQCVLSGSLSVLCAPFGLTELIF